MNRFPLFLFMILTACARTGGGPGAEPMLATTVCSDAWYRSVEERVPTGDGQGHGPDVGSEEWKSTVEFRLGVRGRPEVPAQASEDWCRYIDARVRASSGKPAGPVFAQGPSYACDAVEPGGIEAMICANARLAALDRKLAEVYHAASQRAADEHPPMLMAEQRGWIKGRDECWKSEDRNRCVEEAYLRRIAELQARYRLVPGSGPVRFVCDGNPAHEVVVTFFKTDPPTLVAGHGDSVAVMYSAPSASGAKYEGRNEMFWEHQGEARVVWGYGATEMRCRKAP